MAYTAIMPLYQAVILALIQGFTEFLPVSSSGHLALAPWLWGWKDPGLTFDIALHLGTLVAIVIYFWKDWVQVLGQGFGLNWGSDPELKVNRSLLWLMAVATVPAGIAGLALHKAADTVLREPPAGMYVIGGMLIGVGLLMWWAERIGSEEQGHPQSRPAGRNAGRPGAGCCGYPRHLAERRHHHRWALLRL